MKENIIQIACDADLRRRVEESAPGLFSGYYVSPGGAVLDESELFSLDSFNHFLRGLDAISSAVLR